MKDLKQEVERFFKALGMKVQIEVDSDFGDDHGDVLVLDNTFLLGFYKPDSSYFLQAIISDPGSRWEPPSEDYRDICSSKKLGGVLTRLMIENTKIALGNMAEEDQERELEELERTQDDAFNRRQA